MMKRSIFHWSLILFIGITACKNDKRSMPEKEYTSTKKDSIQRSVETLEEIAELANEGKLSEVFTEEEMRTEIITVNEGMSTLRSTTINPGTANEVHIDFLPNDSTKVWRVTIANASNKYRSETGIKPGMTVSELNTLNRKPVNFYGFQWDFAGAVDFNEGALQDKKLFAYVKSDAKIPSQFIGDAPHSSLDENALKLELYVYKIIYEDATAEPL
jgi:hypothetical protein